MTRISVPPTTAYSRGGRMFTFQFESLNPRLFSGFGLTGKIQITVNDLDADVPLGWMFTGSGSTPYTVAAKYVDSEAGKLAIASLKESSKLELDIDRELAELLR